MKKIILASVAMCSFAFLASCATDNGGGGDITSEFKANTPQTQQLVDLSNRYGAFAHEAERAADSANISSAQSIGLSVISSELFARPEMVDGAKASAIIGGSKSPEFRKGISKIASEVGRNGLIERLTNSPSFVRSIPGYDEGQKYASLAVSPNFDKINNAAKSLHDVSYSMQKEKWSNVAQNKQPLLDGAKRAWESPLPTVSYDKGDGNQPSSTLLINDRTMAAAALLAIRADDNVIQMMGLNSAKSCTFAAYLNMRMCLSASKFPYEHTFCLSQHGQSEPNSCVQEAVSTLVKNVPVLQVPTKPATPAKATKTTTRKRK